MDSVDILKVKSIKLMTVWMWGMRERCLACQMDSGTTILGRGASGGLGGTMK